MIKPNIQFNLVNDRGKEMLHIRIPYDPILIREVKKIEGICWNTNQKVWQVLFEDQLLPLVRELFEQYAKIEDGALIGNLIHKAERQQYENAYTYAVQKFEAWLKSKRYSPNTQKTYLDALKVFLQFMKVKPLDEIDSFDLIRFNNEYILRRGYSTSYQNQVVNAVKLFFQTIENRRLEIDEIHRPRREHRLPNVLSKEEVKRILEAHRNLKHKTMLSLIYACGLRRSELLNLVPADIQSQRNLLKISQSKGKKDRIVPVSDKLIELLRKYYKEYNPQTWLFEGQERGSQYSEKSLQSVLKQALEKAKIQKPVTLHWLRHSYATHLLESGTDLRFIQELLGHNSSRTTEIYTHVSNHSIQKIKSPFDDL